MDNDENSPVECHPIIKPKNNKSMDSKNETM